MNNKNLDFLNGKPPEPPKKYSDNASYDDPKYDNPSRLNPKKPDPTATEFAD